MSLFYVIDLSFHKMHFTFNWLVTYLGAVHQKENCHYRTSPIGYWGKGSTVGW